ncbi:response regulator [Sorangium sp. So ce291]|uniref:response regulator n=1 Tax=Sorangium sp. So ce291 TaxID=3133294 RepID=UPI003F628971
MAKLLVIDDDSGTLAWMAEALEGAAHDVRAVSSGSAALELLRTWKPDLIVTDFLMPEMDGFTFSRLVQSRDRVPVMLVSAVNKPAEAILRGVAGYVKKPVTTQELRAAVERVLGAAAEGVTLLVVDDDASIRECYRMILEPRFVVREAENGRDALALLSTEAVALAIVDVHMPVMNGVELIRAMRDDVRFCTIPVVVQTSDRMAARAPVWTDLHVAQTIMKDEFMDWLLTQIDAHIAPAPPRDAERAWSTASR